MGPLGVTASAEAVGPSARLTGTDTRSSSRPTMSPTRGASTFIAADPSPRWFQETEQ